MLTLLHFVDTPAGRLALGATVYSPQGQRQGILTSLTPTGTVCWAEVDGVHVVEAYYLCPVAPAEPVGGALLAQAATGVASGAFEVRLPWHGDRIYFADTPAQVVALLALTIGLRGEDPAHEAARLEEAAQGGPLRELRFRGSFGLVGPLAYVSSRQARPGPKFGMGAKVRFFGREPAYTVNGLVLVKASHEAATYPAGQWQYLCAEMGQPYAIEEKHTSPA